VVVNQADPAQVDIEQIPRFLLAQVLPLQSVLGAQIPEQDRRPLELKVPIQCFPQSQQQAAHKAA
jgi:hypothetical protein